MMDPDYDGLNLIDESVDFIKGAAIWLSGSSAVFHSLASSRL
jgi:hypothetical protein